MQCDLQKNFVKRIENLPQHLSEKFIGDNLSITDIALKNCDLSIISIAQGFFEVIDYRYRFGTECLSCRSLSLIHQPLLKVALKMKTIFFNAMMKLAQQET